MSWVGQCVYFLSLENHFSWVAGAKIDHRGLKGELWLIREKEAWKSWLGWGEGMTSKGFEGLILLNMEVNLVYWNADGTEPFERRWVRGEVVEKQGPRDWRRWITASTETLVWDSGANGTWMGDRARTPCLLLSKLNRTLCAADTSLSPKCSMRNTSIQSYLIFV
jgi:hypothetical protein